MAGSAERLLPFAGVGVAVSASGRARGVGAARSGVSRRMAASVGPGTRTKTKKKHFVPQRVKVLRSADPLLGVLAWGINHQVIGFAECFSGGGEYRASPPLLLGRLPPASVPG